MKIEKDMVLLIDNVKYIIRERFKASDVIFYRTVDLKGDNKYFTKQEIDKIINVL